MQLIAAEAKKPTAKKARAKAQQTKPLTPACLAEDASFLRDASFVLREGVTIPPNQVFGEVIANQTKMPDGAVRSIVCKLGLLKDIIK